MNVATLLVVLILMALTAGYLLVRTRLALTPVPVDVRPGRRRCAGGPRVAR